MEDGVKQDQRNTQMAASLERTHELPKGTLLTMSLGSK